MILGINTFHGDASCALVEQGRVLAAVAEERINRIKHSAGFPSLALKEVFRIAGADPRDLFAIAVGRNPQVHRGRKLFYLSTHPRMLLTALMRRRVHRSLYTLTLKVAKILNLTPSFIERIRFYPVEHHLAHAASAFFASPFSEAWILTMDGFGDFVSLLIARGMGRRIEPMFRLFYPHSLGILYQATTQFIGFPHYGDEGKTMGLSPYGDSSDPSLFTGLYQILPGPPYFKLQPEWFRHFHQGIPLDFFSPEPRVPPLYTPLWEKYFGPPRDPAEPLTSREQNLAWAAQFVLEAAVFNILSDLYKRWSCRNLCLAGGVALNCVLNGKILTHTPFEHCFVFPAAGDDGLAVGAAYWVEAVEKGVRPEPVRVPLWGPEFSREQCLSVVHSLRPPARIEIVKNKELLYRRAAMSLSRSKILGWFSGRMEYGPRALGSRSILADPRNPSMKDRLNRRIKRREPFRPFAPAIMREHVREWFVSDCESPAMLHVIPFRPEKRSLVPAVVHVDGTGRLQTVTLEDHPRFYALLKAFYEETGVPLLLNTSFNENEPIVCTPEEALQCFLRTDMDILVLENIWIEREGGNGSFTTYP